jgi:hypothetical protein
MDGYNVRPGGRTATLSCLEAARFDYDLLTNSGVDVEAELRRSGVDPELLRQTGVVTGPFGIRHDYLLWGGVGLGALLLVGGIAYAASR